MMTKDEVLLALANIEHSCSERDWDSCGAEPVPLIVVDLARQLIRPMLALLPLPDELVAGSYGEIEVLWWRVNRGRSVTLEIWADEISVAKWSGEPMIKHAETWQQYEEDFVFVPLAAFDAVRVALSNPHVAENATGENGGNHGET